MVPFDRWPSLLSYHAILIPHNVDTTVVSSDLWYGEESEGVAWQGIGGERHRGSYLMAMENQPTIIRNGHGDVRRSRREARGKARDKHSSLSVNCDSGRESLSYH